MGRGWVPLVPILFFLFLILIIVHGAKHILPAVVAGVGDQDFAITVGEVGERILDKLAFDLPVVKVGLVDYLLFRFCSDFQILPIFLHRIHKCPSMVNWNIGRYAMS